MKGEAAGSASEPMKAFQEFVFEFFPKFSKPGDPPIAELMHVTVTVLARTLPEAERILAASVTLPGRAFTTDGGFTRFVRASHQQ